MRGSMADIQSPTAEIRRGKKKKEELEMWANAQPDGRPAQHRWRPCSTPQSLADAHYLTAVQYHCQDAKPVEISWGAPNYRTDLSR